MDASHRCLSAGDLLESQGMAVHGGVDADADRDPTDGGGRRVWRRFGGAALLATRRGWLVRRRATGLFGATVARPPAAAPAPAISQPVSAAVIKS